MILINKKEKNLILNKFPHAYIIRTCVRKSNRHRYYCKEEYKVMKYLDKLRGDNSASRRRYPDGKPVYVD